ncbi:hypothetical protein [Thermomonas fusca]
MGVTINPAVFSALAALFGAFLGAALTRRTEYVRWLRQSRSEVFADFLSKMHASWSKAIDIINDKSIQDLEAGISLSEIFIDLETQSNVVRLYLPQQERAKFSILVQQLSRAQARSISSGKRMEITKETTDAIQALFERRLHV